MAVADANNDPEDDFSDGEDEFLEFQRLAARSHEEWWADFVRELPPKSGKAAGTACILLTELADCLPGDLLGSMRAIESTSFTHERPSRRELTRGARQVRKLGKYVLGMERSGLRFPRLTA